jgi:hypothetical protein
MAMAKPKWLSRKLLMAAGSGVAVFLINVGIPPELANSIVGPVVEIVKWYLGAQGAVDAAKAIKGIE